MAGRFNIYSQLMISVIRIVDIEIVISLIRISDIGDINQRVWGNAVSSLGGAG